MPQIQVGMPGFRGMVGLGDVQVPCCSAWNMDIHSVLTEHGCSFCMNICMFIHMKYRCSFCMIENVWMGHFLKRFKALKKHSGILILEEIFYSVFSWSTPEQESLKNSEKAVMYYCGETGWSPVSNTFCTGIRNGQITVSHYTKKCFDTLVCVSF